jgi:alkaline phosphatase D
MTRDESLSRRDLLRGVGALGAALPLAAGCGSDDGGGEGGQQPPPDDGLPHYQWEGDPGPAHLFQHGVASGDPLPDSVILWTRVTPGGTEAVEVWWEISVDAAFTQRVQVGTVETGANRDFTVKLDVAGLEAGAVYFYRFLAMGRTSPVGRTRTAPAGAVARLRFAVASCASLAHGWFHAYEKIAARADLDAVLHLGDYIYEYASGVYGDVRPYEPEHEIITLDDYRTRYAQYRRDAQLQEAHRQHPFITIWDDHETADNSWKDGAVNHTESSEGSWQERKAAAMQAYREWMPIRESKDGRIFRSLSFGELADLILLDTRLWGRSETSATLLAPPPEPDPDRTLLGDDQAAWLEERLRGSGARWKIVAQQVMLGSLIVDPGKMIANLDQWHGYPASRKRLLDFLRAEALDGVVVLTGDIHSSWAQEIVDDPNDPAQYDPATGEGSLCVEFVTPGITSPGIPDQYLGLIDTARQYNPNNRWIEPSKRGYIVLDVDAERTQAAWYLLDDVANESAAKETLAAVWSVAHGENRLSEDDDATAPPEDVPPPAP